VLLSRNEDQEYNNPLANSQPASADKGANCALALSVSGASRSRLCPDGPRVHLSGPAYMPSCVLYVQTSDFHLINVFCVVIVVRKGKLLCLVQVVFSYFVLHSNKIAYLWCLQPKLHICAACCSDRQM